MQIQPTGISLFAALSLLLLQLPAQEQQSKPASKHEYRWYVAAEPGITYHWHRVRPEVLEVFSTFSSVLSGRIAAGYRITPRVWLEASLGASEFAPAFAVYRRPTSGLSSYWGSPLPAGSFRVALDCLRRKRISIQGFTELGMSYLPKNGYTGSFGTLGPSTSDGLYRFVMDTPTFVQPWIPYPGIGIRPEVRLTRKGRLWTYLSLSVQGGWREAAGLDLTYFTEPSHSQPNTATSRFSGSGWTLGWGWKVYLGKNAASQP